MGKRNFSEILYAAMNLFRKDQEQKFRDRQQQFTTTLDIPHMPHPRGASYRSEMPRHWGCFGGISDKRLPGRGTSLEERKAMRRGGHADPRWDAAW